MTRPGADSTCDPESEGIALSVVVPIHNEGGTVRFLFTEICAALEPLRRPFEVLLVDDGSTDAGGRIMDEMAAGDARLRPLHLDGNFGEAAALSAGFAHARGTIVLTLDGDLQNDPAELPRLLELLESGGYRSVSGWRRRRTGGLIRVLPSRLANWLIARVSGVPARDTGCGLKAHRSEVVRGICLPDGLHRFMPAVFGVCASEFAQLQVADRPRRSGQSHYGLSRFRAVLRDLLVVRYLPHHVVRGFHAAGRLRAVGILSGVVGVLCLVAGRPGWASAAGLLAGALVALAASLAANLDRWRCAQQRRTYRVRPTPPERGGRN